MLEYLNPNVIKIVLFKLNCFMMEMLLNSLSPTTNKLNIYTWWYTWRAVTLKCDKSLFNERLLRQ